MTILKVMSLKQEDTGCHITNMTNKTNTDSKIHTYTKKASVVKKLH